jgi:hypothetical protein
MDPKLNYYDQKKIGKFSWRITKYNPIHRNSTGAYTKDEWSSYSDIGKKIGEIILSLDEYTKVENAYIETLFLFLRYSKTDYFQVVGLEKHHKPECKERCLDLSNLFKTIHNDAFLFESTSIKNTIRLVLRNNIWCKLVNQKFEAHFGHDYYMYVVSTENIPPIADLINSLDLYCESFESPYSSHSNN